MIMIIRSSSSSSSSSCSVMINVILLLLSLSLGCVACARAGWPMPSGARQAAIQPGRPQAQSPTVIEQDVIQVEPLV